MGPDVVYVSGRVRPADESNGKSGNLNNALTQIYPDGTKIPRHEIVCIMDADQVILLPVLLVSGLQNRLCLKSSTVCFILIM